MRGSFSVVVEIYSSEHFVDCDGSPSLEPRVIEAGASWGHDDVEGLLFQAPDALREITNEHCTEIGTYELSGNYWMTDFEDDYGDISLEDVEVKKLTKSKKA